MIMLSSRYYQIYIKYCSQRIVCYTSLKIGILGDSSKFNVAGDRTCMPTQASPYGKKVYEFNLKLGQSCNCSRKFTEPCASRGLDSLNENTIMCMHFTDLLIVIVLTAYLYILNLLAQHAMIL